MAEDPAKAGAFSAELHDVAATSDQYTAELNVRGEISRLDRERAEMMKFVAEQRKLMAEASKLSEEQFKFGAEQAKLYSEAFKLDREVFKIDRETLKIERDWRLSPWLAAAVLVGALAGVVSVVLQLVRWFLQ